jgi:hypothetical protein
MRFVSSLRLPLLAGLLAVPAFLVAAQPQWWATRGVVAGQADDHVVANLGQLKTLSVAAALEMELRLSGGAGTDITNVVSPWLQPAALGASRDDYAALTVGQLKYVAKRFYDRLGLSGSYPWTSSSADDDDYAVANLGQLKYVFSFNILTPGVTDTDADGLADSWEETFFGTGNLTQNGTGNVESPTPDALSNRAESLVGSDPTTVADESAPAAAELALVVYSP